MIVSVRVLGTLVWAVPCLAASIALFSIHVISNLFKKKSEEISTRDKVLTFLNVISGTFFILSLLSLSAFTFVKWWVTGILVCVFCLILVIYHIIKDNFVWRSSRKKAYRQLPDISKGRFAQRHLTLIAFVVLALLFGLIASYITRDACITVVPIGIHFRITRPKDICSADNGRICMIYATFNTNTSSDIIIHFHSSFKLDDPRTYFKKIDGPWSLPTDEIESYVQAIPQNIDIEVDRWIYYSFVVGLEPNSFYYFHATDGELENITANPAYTMIAKTVPVHGPIKYAMGGDSGTTKISQKILEQVNHTQPLFLSIGGDIAYENDMKSCYFRVDDWLEQVREYTSYGVNQIGRLPYIFSIGNHEGGGNFGSSVSFFYSQYFVQDTLERGRSPSNLPTYQHHYIGNQVLAVLDSGAISSPKSQVKWLESVFSNSPPDSLLTAVYHAPLYPASRPYNSKTSKIGREFFGPVFDKYHVLVAFENHDHAYKRTPKIKNQKIDPSGTLYIGDGSMGPCSRSPHSPQESWWLAHSCKCSFFFSVHKNDTHFHIQAISEDGATIDEFVVGK